MKSHLSIFSFYGLCVCVCFLSVNLRILSLNLDPKDFLLCFFPKKKKNYNFIFYIQSMTMLVNFCIRCEIQVQLYSSAYESNCSSTSKNCFFTVESLLYHCQNLIGRFCVNLFLGCLFCSTYFLCLSLQCHTILINFAISLKIEQITSFHFIILF